LKQGTEMSDRTFLASLSGFLQMADHKMLGKDVPVNPFDQENDYERFHAFELGMYVAGETCKTDLCPCKQGK
jgi:hypothetical protein